MSLYLYNSLSRTLERFKPLRQEEVKVYYCGPTPYNYAHIGNLRAYLYEDFVVRTLRFLGYKVRTVMNITDIDDKTIRDSQNSGKSLQEFTEFYAGEFLADLEKLGIEQADTIAPISTLIPDMGTMIQGLLDKGYAYLADDGSVYYSVSKFKKYGELAHLDMSGMISSVRIDNDEYDKDQVADFALWKAYDKESDGPNSWEIEVTVDGEKKTLKGRPGWHIECSACNMHYFGPQIDIHMGGIDNLFPHHQNEVAQTEAYTGKQFATYWMHGGHLLVDNKKMSKSAGNFYTLRDIVEKMIGTDEQLIYRGFRLMALQNQYRDNFNFTFERLGAAINTIKGLDEMIKRLGRYRDLLMRDVVELSDEDRELTAKGRIKFHDITREFRENQQAFMQEFIQKLEDDFDTLSAMQLIYEYQTYINTGIDDELFTVGECQSLIGLMQSWDAVVAIFDFSLLESESLPIEISKLAEARMLAKSLKDWAEADRIRDELVSLGYKMIDEKDGWRVEKSNLSPMHNLEIEAKYIHIDLFNIREKLEQSEFELVYPEFDVFRATLICHDPHMTLRVRKEYGQTTMTYKYRDPAKTGALGTEEVEIVVDDFDKALHILQMAHKPKHTLLQESRRELWSDGENEVCIDEWPGTGKYVEIESPSEEELIRVTELLGLDYSTALFGRVGVVYEALGYDLEAINKTDTLTFENPPMK